ncbi:hypothetical protein UFOVP1672_46 [uncultured Caudovirales phage]|uniref:Uncharacterized protein n=1 Tax=uncultured Caudovirales phage TaxID=2100421 RepID=A0A6J5SBK8_9CAUD|nr:hypothetical protein UFOVP988_68 [uncultured Caudovirales phage]CAB4211053.1 hypothetical protein UFOVP1425_68 [uncultured Caudovirales phage]CAB4223427.1 hypothetical protein UFOVP1672_46 [uncultured Caudovirales phage]
MSDERTILIAMDGESALRADLAKAQAERDELTAKVVVMKEAMVDLIGSTSIENHEQTDLLCKFCDEPLGHCDERCPVPKAVRTFNTLHARAKLLGDVVEALDEYKHAMEGFAEAVRAESGHAYPWPAQDIALEKVASVLAAWRAKP